MRVLAGSRVAPPYEKYSLFYVNSGSVGSEEWAQTGELLAARHGDNFQRRGFGAGIPIAQ
jgi:hypothetical protein